LALKKLQIDVTYRENKTEQNMAFLFIKQKLFSTRESDKLPAGKQRRPGDTDPGKMLT
jgi:hypothetical protein